MTLRHELGGVLGLSPVLGFRGWSDRDTASSLVCEIRLLPQPPEMRDVAGQLHSVQARRFSCCQRLIGDAGLWRSGFLPVFYIYLYIYM